MFLFSYVAFRIKIRAFQTYGKASCFFSKQRLSLTNKQTLPNIFFLHYRSDIVHFTCLIHFSKRATRSSSTHPQFHCRILVHFPHRKRQKKRKFWQWMANSKTHHHTQHNRWVALGGLVVSVLATGLKVRGFKPGRGRWILRVIKSAARLPSEGK
jgi:hypothetical protein